MKTHLSYSTGRFYKNNADPVAMPSNTEVQVRILAGMVSFIPVMFAILTRRMKYGGKMATRSVL